MITKLDLSKIFQLKNKSEDIRLGDIIYQSNSNEISLSTNTTDQIKKHNTSVNELKLSLLGYPDDDGISINGGRIGAAKAPDVIRKYLYKMTPSWRHSLDFLDIGNISTTNVDLKTRHNNGAIIVLNYLNKNYFNISIGGGHDYGYADGKGFLDFCKTQNSIKPLIINIDAHMDVRSDVNGLSSGTPFYRLLNEYPDDFDFIEFGIQNQCNSLHHIDWAIQKNTKIIYLNEIIKDGYKDALKPYNDILTKNRPAYLSIDIDAFSSAYAMGCSQSWSSGLAPNKFLSFLEHLVNNLDIKNTGIYEVSPPLDFDDQTSKLAAQIIYKLIELKLNKQIINR